MSKDDHVLRVLPFYYLHILDQNTNVTRLEVGPKIYVRSDHEVVMFGPEPMVTVPPQHYCIIANPVVRDLKSGAVQFDPSGQVKLSHADLAIRLHEEEPFPLYPGEELRQGVTRLPVVAAQSAMLLATEVDFSEDKEVPGKGGKMSRVQVQHRAGDEWLFEGPGTYIPRKEVIVLRTINGITVLPNQALRLRARRECLDRENHKRVEGEEWLVKRVGNYLLGAYEELVSVVQAYVLTDKTALHMVALRSFTDDFGQNRKSGEEWLITRKMAETHIPHVYEQVQSVVNIVTLTNRQYCVVLDPVDANGRPQLGKKKLVRGECSFFLQPHEHLEDGIQNVYVLNDNEGLVLRVEEKYTDADGTVRQPGDRWMIRGPVEYIPDVEVKVVQKSLAIPLDVNEGIYVRDMKTGKVRAVCGCSYMLTQDEELWTKDLPPQVERLLSLHALYDNPDDQPTDAELKAVERTLPPRDKTRTVGFRVPHNAAVQVYDYKTKRARVVFGPQQVMLAPDEQFTQLSLSGGTPKQPNKVRTLCLFLGPRFSTDIVTVETSDHARLSLQLAYNWHFDVVHRTDLHQLADTMPELAAKLFSVPDFIGDACKALASRIRGAVASVQFDNFHKNSARLIRSSVFGLDDNQKIRGEFVFPQNGLVITSIDIQNVEPVDQKTRDSLQKSVQLAIEITTSSQEAAARHEAERLEQEARGHLERQKIKDEADAEKARYFLLELKATSDAVASTGQAKAEAQSRAESARIEGEAAVEQAKLNAAAATIEAESSLKCLTATRQADLLYQREVARQEVAHRQASAEIEISRYHRMVEAIGKQTLSSIATAGPEVQVQYLRALNLRSTLITSGGAPVNLFQTAKGLLGQMDFK